MENWVVVEISCPNCGTVFLSFLESKDEIYSGFGVCPTSSCRRAYEITVDNSGEKAELKMEDLGTYVPKKFFGVD